MKTILLFTENEIVKNGLNNLGKIYIRKAKLSCTRVKPIDLSFAVFVAVSKIYWYLSNIVWDGYLYLF